MPDTKISGLAVSTDITATDRIPFVDDIGGVPTTKAIAFSDLITSVMSSSDYSGTYIASLTNVTNVTSSTDYAAWQYMRVGNVVTVSGAVGVTATASAAATEVGISLPIASNFTTTIQCRGTGVEDSVWGDFGAISGDTVNDRASLRYTADSTDARTFSIIFTYLIA